MPQPADAVVMPMPLQYRACSTPRRSRTPRWSEVRTRVDLPVRVVGSGEVDGTFPVAGWSAAAGFGAGALDAAHAVVVDGRAYWPCIRDAGAFVREVAAVTPDWQARHVRWIAEEGPKPGSVHNAPYGIDLSSSAERRTYVRDEEALGRVEWSDRADRLADAVAAADAMVVFEGRVHTRRFEPAVVWDSGGRISLRLLDAVSPRRLLADLDLEQDVARLEKMIGRPGCPEVPVALPEGLTWTLPDVEVSALLGLRRCIRSMFQRTERDSVHGDGDAYAPLPEELEEGLILLRRAVRRLDPLVGLAGGREAAAEARAAVAAYAALVRSLPPERCNWDGAVRERKLRDMTACLGSWDAIHSRLADLPPARRVHADDVEAVELAGSLVA